MSKDRGADDARKARLAAALRENLKRRKAPRPEPDGPDAPPPEPEG